MNSSDSSERPKGKYILGRNNANILVSAAKYAVLFAVLGAILAYVFVVLQMALNAGSDPHPAVSEGKKKSATEGEKK